uniref:SOCS box domain-containing protein n=1 Tax=Macrostomum lignano TaxID=282301 RepID=A0A1I8G882_9PLAT
NGILQTIRPRRHCWPLLDLWHGTLTYFLNRQCLGVAARAVSRRQCIRPCDSTAAKSGVKLIRALSLPITLQALSCRALRHLIPDRLCVTEALTLPPGLVSLLTNNLPYLIWPAYRHNGPSARSTAAASTSNDDVEDDIDAESGTASVSKRRRLDEDDDAAGPGSALA